MKPLPNDRILLSSTNRAPWRDKTKRDRHYRFRPNR